MAAALINFFVVRILWNESNLALRELESDVHFLVFPDCWTELLLDVADTGIGSACG
jgi:hypothetical protein